MGFHFSLFEFHVLIFNVHCQFSSFKFNIEYTDPPEAPSSYGPAPRFALGHKNYMTAHAIVVVADAAVAGSGPPPKPSQSSS